MGNKRKEDAAPPAKSNSVNTSYLNDVGAADVPPTLEKTSAGKSSGRNAKDARAERRVDMQRRLAKEQDKVSWKKQAGVIAAIILMCGAGLMQFVMTVWGFLAGTGISHISIQDTAQLKSVLFDGDPWLVYCVNNETMGQRIPQVLEESAHTLYSSLSVKTATLNCWDPTESGRSVAQRFGLNLKPPMTFLVANNNKPRLVNMLGVSRYEDLEKKLKPALKVNVNKIKTLKQWTSFCTNRKSCIVIGHKNKAQLDYAQDLIKPTLERHRGSKFVSLDTSFWQLKLDDGVLATRSADGKGKSADVLCLSRDEASSKGNTTHSGLFLQSLDSSSLDKFITACETRQQLVKLEKPPKINARPTKPKKVTAPTPAPRPPTQQRDASKKVDRVGSRDSLNNEEPLFEAVDEDEDDEDGDEDEEEESEGEEIEI
mmetsp:Transcript_36506/g.77662  ORF Transcript_36506/g.77662 Transcript_36506/m.77662 type:complete len:428 (+) Transcript_36506:88-1371(+)